MCSYKAYADTRQPCTLMTLTRASHTLIPSLSPPSLSPPHLSHPPPKHTTIKTTIPVNERTTVHVAMYRQFPPSPPPSLLSQHMTATSIWCPHDEFSLSLCLHRRRWESLSWQRTCSSQIEPFPTPYLQVGGREGGREGGRKDGWGGGGGG